MDWLFAIACLAILLVALEAYSERRYQKRRKREDQTRG